MEELKVTVRGTFRGGFGNFNTTVLCAEWAMHDAIFVPIHVYLHWTLGVLYPKELRVEYFDSMPNMQRHACVLTCLKQILCQLTNTSGRLHRASHIDIDEDKVHTHAQTSSRQGNGVDCGVFLLANMHAIANGISHGEVKDESMVERRLQMIREMCLGWQAAM